MSSEPTSRRSATVAERPPRYARVRPSALTRRASTSSSASSGIRSPSSERRSFPSSNTPSTYASAAPGRTIPARALPPSSRSSACASTVFPAPVSPVSTLSPGASRSSARSISRRSSTRSSKSTGDGLPAPPDGPARPATLSSHQPAELLAQPPVERRSRDLGEQRRLLEEAAGGRLARPQLAGRPPVARDVDGLLARAVLDGQHVRGRRDQRPRGQRVRGDERHDVAAHAPRQHGPAVGQVVARRAGGRGHDEPVAAHVADLLALQRVGQHRHPLADLAVDRDVVDRRLDAARRLHRDRRQAQQVELHREGAREGLLERVGVDGGQEPDLTEVHREDGHARARVAPQGAQDGPVAAQDDHEIDALDLVGGVDDDALSLPQLVLARLLGVETQLPARRRRAPQQHVARRARLLGPAMGEDDRPLHPGSASSAAASRSSTRPARPASASHTNVSRLPLGPGSPLEAKPSTEQPSDAPHAATSTRAARRTAGSRTTPPLPTSSRPASNCGLTMHSASKRSAAHASTAGSTLRSEMNETSQTMTSGA